jgi:hypothetical protein
MIVGLLNLQGSVQMQAFVQQTLVDSGLLGATDVLYYSRARAPHPNATLVKEDKDLFMMAKKTPNAFVWSLNTLNFTNSNRLSLGDWLQYELFFIVTQWRMAVQKLEMGYDSYGVNLYHSPEPHYEAYCFWMKSDAMNRQRLTHPYCAFQSFTNHYLDRFPSTVYLDFDAQQPAPLSDRRLQERLAVLTDDTAFGVLATLLVQSKCYFDAQPSMRAERPYVINDVADQRSLAFIAPGLGRIDALYKSDMDGLLTRYRGLGWSCNLNLTEQLDHRKADIIYTTLDRVEQWLPKLSHTGTLLVKGMYQGRLVSKAIGEYTLIGSTDKAFAIL